MELDEQTRYKCGSPIKGKVLVVLFPDESIHFGNTALNALREKIESSFKIIGYEPLEWNDHGLNHYKKEEFMDGLKKVASELLPSESFVMIVKCFQKNGDLHMTSGKTFKMEEVYHIFEAKSCAALIGKPKLFVFDTHPSEAKSRDVHPSGKMKKTSRCPLIVPNEADIMVVYSIEDYMDEPASTAMASQRPSFMDGLTQVLEYNIKQENGHQSIADLIVIVSNRVKQQIGQDKPTVLSTLRSPYYLK